MRMQRQIEIDAPIERVFRLLSEPEEMKRWIPELMEVTHVSGEINTPGATFKQKLKEGGRVGTYDGEVLAFEAPRHVAVRIFNRMFEVRTDYKLDSDGQRTRLDYTADLVPKVWWMKLMTKLFGRFNERIVDEQMRRLQQAAKSS